MKNEALKPLLDFLHFDCPTKGKIKVLNELDIFIDSKCKQDVFILSGAAGTGKTSIMSAVIGKLLDIDLGFHIAAPTGRAARIIGKKTNQISTTIHSLIYNPISDKDKGTIHFERVSNNKEDEMIYIIDEASMVSSENKRTSNDLFSANNDVLSDFIQFVKEGNSSNKIIFLGDKNQLSPVGEKSSCALDLEYIESTYDLKGQLHKLHEVKRQDSGTEISRLAQNLVNRIEDDEKLLPLNKDAHKSIFIQAPSIAQDFKSKGLEESICINATHKMNKFANAKIRESMFGSAINLVQEGDILCLSRKWSRDGISLFSGDQIIVKEIQIATAEQIAGLHFAKGRFVGRDLNNEEIEFCDYLLLDCLRDQRGAGQILTEAENKLKGERMAKNKQYREDPYPWNDKYVGALHCNYGYAMTCNKAQGGEWNQVYLGTFFLPSNNFSYTAITRAVNTLNLIR